ncbi:MAG: sialidase family protein [Phycisphaerales bacterium]
MFETTVFDRGEAGYAYYRSPRSFRAQDGTILAFAEARRDSGSDFGNIDLAVKPQHRPGTDMELRSRLSPTTAHKRRATRAGR